MSMQTAEAPRAVRKRRNAELPTKTTLNLVIREKSELAPSRWIPAAILIILAAALFSKFAVVDRFARLQEMENKLADKQGQLWALEDSYADFDEVKAQYNQYTYKGFDRSIADRQAILDLLEQEIIPYCETQAISISGNNFSTTLTGLTLDQVSSMMARLEANPLVEGVTVATAGYDDADPSTQPYATMSIVFTNPEAADAAEEGGAQ